MMDAVLALDLGTTNWKAGLYREGQEPLIRSMPVRTVQDQTDASVYDPQALWEAVKELVYGFPAEALAQVKYVGLTSMAEAGLLVDENGKALSPILPWNDLRGTRYLDAAEDRFNQTGLPKHSKYSLFKLLALREEIPLSSARWMGVPEYVLWKLTGVHQTEPTLAARTYAYDIVNREWDLQCLRHHHLPETLFPPVMPSGMAAGAVKGLSGLHLQATAAVCGHDHLCAAYALDALREDRLCVSAGTAQVMLGLLGCETLTDEQRRSGLSFGPSPAGAGLVVLGSIQSAGGSVNCWREWLNMSPEAWWKAQEERTAPSDLLYLPYLSGSGAPHMNPLASGMLLGLRRDTSREQIARAVMEGVAFETRWILEQMHLNGRSIIAAGGLSRQSSYMQLLADVLNTRVTASLCQEATLEGAAMLAGGQRWETASKIYTPQKERCAWEKQYNRYLRLLPFALETEDKENDQ